MLPNFFPTIDALQGSPKQGIWLPPQPQSTLSQFILAASHLTKTAVLKLG